MKMSTVALVISYDENGPDSHSPVLVECLFDQNEIEFLEAAIYAGDPNPLQLIYNHRERQFQQIDEFGDHVEALLVQPFLKSEIKGHCIQWFKSQIKIEQYHKVERGAALVVGEYAFKIFKNDPSKTDFFLATSQSQVRVRVFLVKSAESSPSRRYSVG